MIAGIITIRTKELGDSPSGYDILLETEGACGCQYASSFVTYTHSTEKRLAELAPHYAQLEKYLRTDPHGDQLKGSLAGFIPLP